MARFSRILLLAAASLLVLVAGHASAQEETVAVADAPQETHSDGVGATTADSTTDTLNSILEESADGTTTASSDEVSAAASNQEDAKTEEPPASSGEQKEDGEPVQAGPLIDIFGPKLLSLEMIDESSAELRPHLTTDALRGKKVIGVYFSADWCGPCRQFTPELVAFYDKMNSRRGRQDEFEIVWVSRCRDVNSYGQYFAHMGGWYALPPEAAMGERGAMLSDKYKVKGIPTLILLDDMGSVITKDARNLIPKDKAGIGFPWRNPLVTLYMSLVPRSLRLMVRSQIGSAKEKFVARVKQVVRPSRAKKAQV